MLCEWGRVRGEHPPPILARAPQGVRAFIFSKDPFSLFSAPGRTQARNHQPQSRPGALIQFLALEAGLSVPRDAAHEAGNPRG
jgi:hypothetical protein